MAGLNRQYGTAEEEDKNNPEYEAQKQEAILKAAEYAFLKAKEEATNNHEEDPSRMNENTDYSSYTDAEANEDNIKNFEESKKLSDNVREGLHFADKTLINVTQFSAEKIMDKTDVRTFLEKQRGFLTEQQFQSLRAHLKEQIEQNTQARWEQEQQAAYERGLVDKKPELSAAMEFKIEDISNQTFKDKSCFQEEFLKRANKKIPGHLAEDHPFRKLLEQHTQEQIRSLHNRWKRLNEAESEKQLQEELKKVKDTSRRVRFSKKDVERKTEYWENPGEFSSFMRHEKIGTEMNELIALKQNLNPELWETAKKEVKAHLETEPFERWKKEYVKIEEARLVSHQHTAEKALKLTGNDLKESKYLNDPRAFEAIMMKRVEKLGLMKLESHQRSRFQAHIKKRTTSLYKEWTKGFEQQDKLKMIYEKQGLQKSIEALESKNLKESDFKTEAAFHKALENEPKLKKRSDTWEPHHREELKKAKEIAIAKKYVKLQKKAEKKVEKKNTSAEEKKELLGEKMLTRLTSTSIRYKSIHSIQGKYFDPFFKAWSTTLGEVEFGLFLRDVQVRDRDSKAFLRQVFSEPTRMRAIIKLRSKDQSNWKLFEQGIKALGYSTKELLTNEEAEVKEKEIRENEPDEILELQKKPEAEEKEVEEIIEEEAEPDENEGEGESEGETETEREGEGEGEREREEEREGEGEVTIENENSKEEAVEKIKEKKDDEPEDEPEKDEEVPNKNKETLKEEQVKEPEESEIKNENEVKSFKDTKEELAEYSEERGNEEGEEEIVETNEAEEEIEEEIEKEKREEKPRNENSSTLEVKKETDSQVKNSPEDPINLTSPSAFRELVNNLDINQKQSEEEDSTSLDEEFRKQEIDGKLNQKEETKEMQDFPALAEVADITENLDKIIELNALIDYLNEDSEAINWLIKSIKQELLMQLTQVDMSEQKKQIMLDRLQQQKNWWDRLNIPLHKQNDFDSFFDSFSGDMTVIQGIQLFIRYVNITTKKHIPHQSWCPKHLQELILKHPKEVFWSMVGNLKGLVSPIPLSRIFIKVHQPQTKSKICFQLSLETGASISTRHHETHLKTEGKTHSITKEILKNFQDYLNQSKESRDAQIIKLMQQLNHGKFQTAFQSTRLQMIRTMSIKNL